LHATKITISRLRQLHATETFIDILKKIDFIFAKYLFYSLNTFKDYMAALNAYIDTLDTDVLVRIFNVIDGQTIKDELLNMMHKEKIIIRDFILNLAKKQPTYAIVKQCIMNGKVEVFQHLTASEQEILRPKILNFARDQATVDYLLCELVDLNEVTDCWSADLDKLILTCISATFNTSIEKSSGETKKLKVRVNPNLKIRKCPLWYHFRLEHLVELNVFAYSALADSNFTEPIDINGQGYDGGTTLHSADKIPDEFLALKPRYDIKNDAGLCALEYRRKMGKSVINLEKYIQGQELRMSEIEKLYGPNCIQLLSDQVKELEAKLLSSNKLLISSNKLLEEYEERMTKLRDIVS